jgi:predicted nucleic acid-binding protein
MSGTYEPKILLDCDVVIHFIKGQKIMELPAIFPGRFVMLDKVYEELMKRSGNFLAIGIFLKTSGIPIIQMPGDETIVREYFALKRVMDSGESACLAVARHKKEYVASSNITQIADYCRTHGIVYYTTMDLLVEAVAKGIMTELEADQFIQEVISRGSRLPNILIRNYKKNP